MKYNIQIRLRSATPNSSELNSNIQKLKTWKHIKYRTEQEKIEIYNK